MAKDRPAPRSRHRVFEWWFPRINSRAAAPASVGVSDTCCWLRLRCGARRYASAPDDDAWVAGHVGQPVGLLRAGVHAMRGARGSLHCINIISCFTKTGLRSNCKAVSFLLALLQARRCCCEISRGRSSCASVIRKYSSAITISIQIQIKLHQNLELCSMQISDLTQTSRGEQ